MNSFIGNVIAGLVAGIVTGLITNYIVTRHFRAIDQRIIIMGMARDLAQECHNLLDLTNRLITQIAIRKYHAYEIIQVLKNLSRGKKRRLRNKMSMEISLGEVQKATLERLCFSIHTKQLEKKLQSNHGPLSDVIKCMGAAVDAAGGLCLEFGRIDDFHTYVGNIEHMQDMTFEDFIEKLEREEVEAYDKIPAGRDELKKTHLDLVIALRSAAVEPKKSFFNNTLMRRAMWFWFIEIALSAINFFLFINLVYEPHWGDLIAHQIGMTTRIIYIFILAYFLLRSVKQYNTKDLLILGAFWMGIWLIFEWAGSLLVGRPVSEILVGWNIFKGYMWPYVLLTYLLSSLIVGTIWRLCKKPGS